MVLFSSIVTRGEDFFAFIRIVGKRVSGKVSTSQRLGALQLDPRTIGSRCTDLLKRSEKSTCKRIAGTQMPPATG